MQTEERQKQTRHNFQSRGLPKRSCHILCQQVTLMSEGPDSLSTMVGHFPPSSSVTGVRCFAAADNTILPTPGLPE